MALKFLNKKGWHTGSLRNIENVWKAEQKRDAEERKLEEIRKQIQEEKERLEIRLLQEQAGLVPRQERLEFLYESGLAVGKSIGSGGGAGGGEGVAFKAPEETQPTNSQAGPSTSASKESSSGLGALFEDKPQSANDSWRKLHSDPLLLIRQREQEAIARIKNNPVQMAPILKSIEESRKNKKKKKKDRDGKKSKKKERHDSEDSEMDEPRRRDDRRRSKHDSSRKRRHDSEDSGKRDERRRDPRHRSEERDRGDSPARNHREVDRDGRRYCNVRDEPGHRRRKAVTMLSEKDRAEKLQEMLTNAEVHEEQRWRRLKKADEEDVKEALDASKLKGRNFLDAAHRSVYGAENGGSATIEESVRRRTHYSQRSGDGQPNAFRR